MPKNAVAPIIALVEAAISSPRGRSETLLKLEDLLEEFESDDAALDEVLEDLQYEIASYEPDANVREGSDGSELLGDEELEPILADALVRLRGRAAY